MFLEVVTPDAKIFEGEVTITTLPGSDGSFQVLNNHAPLVSSLTKGPFSYRTKEGELFEYKVSGGVAEVLNNRVTVLAESIEEE